MRSWSRWWKRRKRRALPSHACRYPPRGRRGWAAGVARAARYGFDADYTRQTTNELLIVCQIESVRGVENADAIAATEGIDFVFIGRNDLAADAGHILDLDHPDVDALMQTAVAAARRHGKRVGTVPSAARPWASLLDDGFEMVLGVGDISILRDAARQDVAAYRAYAANRGGAGRKGETAE